MRNISLYTRFFSVFFFATVLFSCGFERDEENWIPCKDDLIDEGFVLEWQDEFEVFDLNTHFFDVLPPVVFNGNIIYQKAIADQSKSLLLKRDLITKEIIEEIEIDLLTNDNSKRAGKWILFTKDQDLWGIDLDYFKVEHIYSFGEIYHPIDRVQDIQGDRLLWKDGYLSESGSYYIDELIQIDLLDNSSKTLIDFYDPNDRTNNLEFARWWIDPVLNDTILLCHISSWYNGRSILKGISNNHDTLFNVEFSADKLFFSDVFSDQLVIHYLDKLNAIRTDLVFSSFNVHSGELLWQNRSEFEKEFFEVNSSLSPTNPNELLVGYRYDWQFYLYQGYFSNSNVKILDIGLGEISAVIEPVNTLVHPLYIVYDDEVFVGSFNYLGSHNYSNCQTRLSIFNTILEENEAVITMDIDPENASLYVMTRKRIMQLRILG